MGGHLVGCAVPSEGMVRPDDGPGVEVAIPVACYGTVSQRNAERPRKSAAARQLVPALAIVALMAVCTVSITRMTVSANNVQELLGTAPAQNAKSTIKGAILKDLARLTADKTKLFHASLPVPAEVAPNPIPAPSVVGPEETEVGPEETDDAPAHSVELPPGALNLDKQIRVEEEAIKGAEEKNTEQEHVVNMDTVKTAELKVLYRQFGDEEKHIHAPDPELAQEKTIAHKAFIAAKQKLHQSLSVLKALEAQLSHLLMLVGVQGSTENLMADDKMQSDIVQQREDALQHEQLETNQNKVGEVQKQVNDVKIQEQVDATELSELKKSGKNDQSTLDQIASVQGRLKHDKDTERRLEDTDLALEKKRLKIDGMIVEQSLLKRGLEAQGKREAELVRKLQGPNGGTEAANLLADREPTDNKPKSSSSKGVQVVSSASSSA